MKMEQPKIPITMLSTEEAEKVLGIKVPTTKKVTEKLESYQMNLSPFLSGPINDQNTVITLQEGIAKAITSPYLRATIILIFGYETTELLLYEVADDRLTENEIIGALISTYESMSESEEYKFVIPFREVNQTCMIAGSGFAQFLSNRSEGMKDKEIVMINIHHDYMRAYVSLKDEEFLLKAICEIHGNLKGNEDE